VSHRPLSSLEGSGRADRRCRRERVPGARLRGPRLACTLV